MEVTDNKFEIFQKRILVVRLEDVLLENKANLLKLSKCANIKGSEFSKEMSGTLGKSTISTDIIKTETIIKAHQSSDGESSEEDDGLYSIEESQTEVNFSVRASSSVKNEPTASESERDDALRGLSDRQCDKTKVKGEAESSSALHEEVDIKSEDEENNQSGIRPPCGKMENNRHRISTRSIRSVKTDGINDDSLELGPEDTPIFRCKNCPYQTTRKNNFVCHVKTHEERTLQCNDCSYKTSSKDYLKKHVIQHASKKPFQCSICSSTFAVRSNFLAHSVVHKPDDQIQWYQCPECPFKTFRKGGLKNHSITHVKPEDAIWNECQQCPFKTKRKEVLKNHAQTHIKKEDRSELFTCPHCPFTTFKTYPLKLHQEKVHKKDLEWYYCADCTYKTNWKPNLIPHTKLHKNNEVLKCPKCSFQTKRKEGLKYHLLMHTGLHKRFSCTVCPFKTTQKHRLKKHIQIKHSNKWFQCEQCPYKTQRRSQMGRHKMVHRTDLVWLQCPQCPFKHIKQERMDKHQRIHNKVKIYYNCEICPYETTTKDCLTKHIRTHIPVDQRAKRKCPLCPYQTPHLSTMIRHRQRRHEIPSKAEWYHCPHCPFKDFRPFKITTHKGTHEPKPQQWYQCQLCPYRIDNKSSLRVHMRSHVPVEQRERFQCLYCSYNSLTRTSLREHEGTKHGKARQVECFHCSMKTYRKGSLIRHIKRMHGKK